MKEQPQSTDWFGDIIAILLYGCGLIAAAYVAVILLHAITGAILEGFDMLFHWLGAR